MSRSLRRNSNYRTNNDASLTVDSENSDTTTSVPASKPQGHHYNSAASIKPKKRFIWPEELHRDFIIAVFDVGLRTADAKSLMKLIPEATSNGATNLQMKATLQKMRNFRYQAKKFENFDEHCVIAGDTNESTGEIHLSSQLRKRKCPPVNSKNEDDQNDKNFPCILDELQLHFDKLEEADSKQSMRFIMKTIQVQQNILKSLIESSQKQQQYYNMMLQKVRDMGIRVTVGDGMISDLNVNNSMNQWNTTNSSHENQFDLNGMIDSSAGSNMSATRRKNPDTFDTFESRNEIRDTDGTSVIPAEVQLKMEMKGHMDMHRQMLMRQYDQLQMHHAEMGNRQQKTADEIDHKEIHDFSNGCKAEGEISNSEIYSGVQENKNFFGATGISIANPISASTHASAGTEFNWDDVHFNEELFKFLTED